MALRYNCLVSLVYTFKKKNKGIYKVGGIIYIKFLFYSRLESRYNKLIFKGIYFLIKS